MKVIVVDDHPLARKGIVSILTENRKIESIIEAACVDDTLSALERENADIVLVDLKLGQEDGIEVIKRGMEIRPLVKFIILTSYLSYDYFLRAEQLGVQGYILKGAVPEDILYIVDLVMRGKKYYDPDLIKYIRSQDTNEKWFDQLTKREKEILQEIGQGYSNEEISKRLFISINTVKKHISSILLKLNIEHRTKLALMVNNLEHHMDQ